MYECYKNIIGVTQNDCPCSVEDRPEDYNVSKSGLYLDELTNISTFTNLGNCDKSTWSMMEEEIAAAIKQFVADSNALLGKKYRLKRKVAKNQILGQIKAKDVVNPSKNYGVITLVCSPIRGGYFTLNSLGTVFSGVGNVTVELHNNIDGLIDTFSIDTVANKLASKDVNLELPLFSKYVPTLEYYFIYQFDENNKPKNTQISCGCGGFTPRFNRDNPYYNHVGSHRSDIWADYVMVGGREVNSLSELQDEPLFMSNNMYGLVLDTSYGCNVTEVICEESLDFKGNPLALSMAVAIKHLAGVKIANRVLNSDKLTKASMVGADEWIENAGLWQEKYNENINYIVNQTDITANDCLKCREVLGLTRMGLFS